MTNVVPILIVAAIAALTVGSVLALGLGSKSLREWSRGRSQLRLGLGAVVLGWLGVAFLVYMLALLFGFWDLF